MTTEELNQWRQLKDTPASLLSDWDYKTLLRLNHLVMEEAHRIHNNDMVGVRTLSL